MDLVRLMPLNRLGGELGVVGRMGTLARSNLNVQRLSSASMNCVYLARLFKLVDLSFIQRMMASSYFTRFR